MTMTESDVTGVTTSGGCLHPDTTLREARRLLEGSDRVAFVVADHHRPVGVITAARLRTSPATDERTVAEVMDYEVVRVEHDWGVPRTMRAFEAAGWASLLKRQPFAEPE